MCLVPSLKMQLSELLLQKQLSLWIFDSKYEIVTLYKILHNLRPFYNELEVLGMFISSNLLIFALCVHPLACFFSILFNPTRVFVHS